MNETLKTIHNLRSIHFNFSSQKIKDEDLKLILDASIRAANATNEQSYSIVVVEDSNVIKELAQVTGTKALVFCVDSNRVKDTAEYLGYQCPVNDIGPFVSGSTDTILAAQTAAIAAKSLGIDSLFSTGIHRGDISRVYKLLNLPEQFCFPLIMLVLGYPKEEPGYKKGRVSGPGIVHYGKYQRVTKGELETLVQHYDVPDAGMEPLWQKNGYKHYLDWFYTEWVSGGEKKDGKSQMYEIMERTGFLE